jgi:hypothetical protein
MLSTQLFASNNIQIGFSSNDLNSQEIKGGFYIGIDGVKKIKDNFFIGVGFNSNSFNVQRTQTSTTLIIKTSGSAYTMAWDFLLGYRLQDILYIPLSVKAGIGYGVTHDNIINENSWNPIYSFSTLLDIYKNFGVAFRYSTTTTKLLNVENVKIKSSIVYLNIKY